MPAVEAPSDLVSLLVLALVQGVTEFLPVSSDGHLVLTQNWLGLEGPHLSIDVALHLGTLGAVLAVFHRDLVAVLRRALRGERRELGLLLLGSVPAAVVGLGLEDFFERLFESGRVAALGLFVTAAFLLVGERARRRAQAKQTEERVLDWRDALWIGAMQALAILPGVSRSGTTIATALARGIPPSDAARFSFLLSIPAVGGAVLLRVPGLIEDNGFDANLLVAIVVTFAVGVVALRILLAFLGRGAFLWCATYCLLLGTTALYLLR